MLWFFTVNLFLLYININVAISTTIGKLLEELQFSCRLDAQKKPNKNANSRKSESRLKSVYAHGSLKMNKQCLSCELYDLGRIKWSL
ncbi:hypothetical protein GDO81_015763 [Engystomops pustulosus]|uniref:Secreted protein n=1 Tax=Engystomops pustulosus TaxID=76066 RepID=A0AAV7AMB8_ENGPU|nr:hypothetical protein GDO81_015763 [Engystomops pustulosus]